MYLDRQHKKMIERVVFDDATSFDDGPSYDCRLRTPDDVERELRDDPKVGLFTAYEIAQVVGFYQSEKSLTRADIVWLARMILLDYAIAVDLEPVFIVEPYYAPLRAVLLRGCKPRESSRRP